MASLQWQRESVPSLPSDCTGPDTEKLRAEGFLQFLISRGEVDGEAGSAEGAVWLGSLRLSGDAERNIWYVALVLVLTLL